MSTGETALSAALSALAEVERRLREDADPGDARRTALLHIEAYRAGRAQVIDESVFVIAESITVQDYRGVDCAGQRICEEHGYFTSRAAAEAYVSRIDRPVRDAFDARMKEYEEKKAHWQAKADQASARGFANPAPRPYLPSAPELHCVIEVESGE